MSLEVMASWVPEQTPHRSLNPLVNLIRTEGLTMFFRVELQLD